MNKKQLIVILLIEILTLLGSYSVKAQGKDISKEQGKSISELGIVYKGMPKGYLENAGFTEYLLLDYKIEGNKEWMTFSDWTTPESGDRIIVIIENGKVKDWVRKGKISEQGQDI